MMEETIAGRIKIVEQGTKMNKIRAVQNRLNKNLRLTPVIHGCTIFERIKACMIKFDYMQNEEEAVSGV